ncbi:MAG: hypothetical protein CMI96_02250 [Pelagibacteraceae bacterium]|nr:hypothetical protein [Pelagibacteraceae bacterium]|tara:strand:- start:37591 stop:38046 length:456 start_codon:yes stop_codon:yes gene_type:complete
MNKNNNLHWIIETLFYICNGLIFFTLLIFTVNFLYEKRFTMSINLMILIFFLVTITKIFYWQILQKNKLNKFNVKKNNFVILTFFILTLILPIYMIYQLPLLINDKAVLKFTFILILIFSMLGMFVERNIFLIHIKNLKKIKYSQNKKIHD